MIGPYFIEAYAIVSADGMIADETGDMPKELQLEADRVYFEDGLEHAAAIVHGRYSQEIQPKSPFRRRLILTRSVTTHAPDPANPLARLWNPAGAPLTEALEALGVGGGRVAVLGGPQVYSLFLKKGYDCFHLSRVPDVRLPGGLRLFLREKFDGEPDDCLSGAGLMPGKTVPLGDGVTVTDWTRR
jgi:dihydrofolate reductase